MTAIRQLNYTRNLSRLIYFFNYAIAYVLFVELFWRDDSIFIIKCISIYMNLAFRLAPCLSSRNTTVGTLRVDLDFFQINNQITLAAKLAKDANVVLGVNQLLLQRFSWI